MASIHSVDPALRQDVRSVLKANPHLQLEAGSRHCRVVNTASGDFVPVPGSSGDHRARTALGVHLRRLATTGRGLIAAKRHLAVVATAVAVALSTSANAGLCAFVTGTPGKTVAATTGATVATGTTLTALGVSAVAHSSGAAIATAGGSYVAYTLGVVGATVGVVTAPLTIGIGAVALVGVAGTAAYCRWRPPQQQTPSTH